MFTVMTWNLQNLGRPDDEAELPAYRQKLEQLAAVVAEQDPDLLGVQEVLALPTDLTPAVWDDLRAALAGATGAAWNGLLSPRPDPRGIRVGWLSRDPITAPVDVAAYPPGLPATTLDDTGTTVTVAKRGALAVRYERADGLQVHALTAHLKSKLLSFPGRTPDRPRFDTRDEGERARFAVYALDQRAAEAAVVRAWATDTLTEVGADGNVLVCGDLNDTPQAATTQILLGPPGSQIGTGGYDSPDRGDAQRLWNLAPAMPAGADWSRIENGVRELIDHVLVSHHLVRARDAVGAVALPGVASVTADPASLAATSAPSDHRPVVARFDL